VILLVFATVSGAKPQNKAKVYLQTKKASPEDSLSNPQRASDYLRILNRRRQELIFVESTANLKKPLCQ
jgi:hypothetical protein